MNHNTEEKMPDFASILSEEYAFPNEDIRADDNEKTDPSVAMKLKDLMEDREESSGEEELDESSEDDSVSDYESESDADSAGTASESEYELSDQHDKHIVSPDTDESGSEYESDDEESIASSESLQASKTIRVGDQDDESGDVSHVYEEENVEKNRSSQQGDWAPPEEEEVCYEATDLGGEDVATASMLAASLVAGTGAVRSGTGWTWVNMIVILSAAGGLGLVLLYAIKRINDLTRLVKTLEENSHMAMNERDVQVITTQVIGDMLEDVENTPSANEKTFQPVEEDGVQTEFEKFEKLEKLEKLEKAQSIADILEDEHPAPDISVSGVVPDDTDTNDKVNPDIVESTIDDPKDVTPDIVHIDAMPSEDKPSVKEDSESVRGDKHVGVVDTDSDQSALEVNELVDRIETMSLSDEPVTTRKSSRLASSTNL